MKIALYSVMVLLLLIFSSSILAQGYIKSDYALSSTFKQSEHDEKLGSGDLLKISGAYTFPLSVKKNDWGQITAWSATLSGSYSSMDNKGFAKTVNPDEVINSNLTLSYLRPLNKRWSLMSSLGAGVYSEPNEISWKSVLVSGGAIFVYKVNDKLDLGIGAGITNSYGTPMAMPMLYLKYNLTGKYQLTIDMSTKVEIAGIAKFSDKFHLRLTAIEMDGISAVTEIEGKSMIYSSLMLKSYITPEFKFGKKSTLFLGAGGTWMRNSKLSERTLKSLWKSFNDDDELYFKPTLHFTVGYRYDF